MPFLAYVLVMIVAVGSVLFGVEVVTSPPRKPATEVTSLANKLTQHEADQRAEKTEGDVSRPLTPLYPAKPAGTKDVRTVYPPSNQAAADQTTGTAPARRRRLSARPWARSRFRFWVHPPAPQKPQIDERPAAKPVQAAARAPNHCDVQ